MVPFAAICDETKATNDETQGQLRIVHRYDLSIFTSTWCIGSCLMDGIRFMTLTVSA